METIKILSYIILALAVTVFFLIRSNINKSKQIKRHRLINNLRSALNQENSLNFNKYPLDVIQPLEKLVNNFLLNIFNNRQCEVNDFILSIDKIEDQAKRDYLNHLLKDTIRRVELDVIAKLIFSNLFDCLHLLKNNSSISAVEGISNKYLKLNLFLLTPLRHSVQSDLVKLVNTSMESYEVPMVGLNKSAEKWLREEMPELLKAELAKINLLYINK